MVLVDQWATWRPHCRREMPDLDRLQQAYGERDLVVVNFSDEPTEKQAAYLAEHAMSIEHGRAKPLPWPDTGRPTPG